MYRGDLARDGHPSGATLNPTQAAKLAPSWNVSLGGSIDGSPAVSDGLVVAGSEAGELAVRQLNDGSPAWTQSGLGSITDSPTISGGRVLVGTLSGRVDAFDERSGRQLWSWHSPGRQPAIWSSPTVYRNRVMIGVASQYGDTPLEAGRLVALDLRTGRPLWDDCVLQGCKPGGGVWSSLAVDSQGRGYVGVGNPDDSLMAVDTATGRRLWETSLHPDQELDLDVGETPILFQQDGQERVAIGSNGGDFGVFDAASGHVVWKRTIVNGSAVHGLLASPAYDGRHFYLPSASPPTGVFAVDPRQGGQVWTRGTAEPVYSSPALGDGVIALGTGAVFGDTAAGEITVLSSQDGHVVWSRDTHSAVWSSPAIVGDRLLVGDHAGTLFSFLPRG